MAIGGVDRTTGGSIGPKLCLQSWYLVSAQWVKQCCAKGPLALQAVRLQTAVRLGPDPFLLP